MSAELAYVTVCLSWFFVAYLMHLRNQDGWFFFFITVGMFHLLLAGSVLDTYMWITPPYNTTGQNWGQILWNVDGFVVIIFFIMTILFFFINAIYPDKAAKWFGRNKE